MEQVVTVFEPNETPITENLWMGNIESTGDTEFIKLNKIKLVISLCGPPPNHIIAQLQHLGTGLLIYNVDDAKISDGPAKNILNHTYEIISSALKNKVGVLVYCKRGHHRSAVVIANYMTRRGIPYKDACRYISSKRPLALSRQTNFVRLFGELQHRYNV